MRAYYAHCKSIYGTPQEEIDITILQNAGFDVDNPSNKIWAARWKEHGMGAKELFAAECDLIVFRSLPSGEIPAGVAKEIVAFVARGKPVLELPSMSLRRTLTVEETRSYLHEVGQR